MAQHELSFPMTRQGVRNLDAVHENVLPVSGGKAPTQAPGTNISKNEQWLSTGTGTVLTLLGLSRGGLGGLMAVAAGGALLYRGYSGHCALYKSLGIDRAQHDATREIVYLGK